jgi:hypothetical protein
MVNNDSMGNVTPLLTSTEILSGTGLFQTAGSASHYLANGSVHRGQGTTAIDPALLTELKQTTTYPPIILTGTLSVDQTLAPTPQVVRNASATANPDRGYAYPVVDYLARALRVENSALPVTLLATNGVIVGIDPNGTGSGILFGQNAGFISEGSPVSSNRFLAAHAFQENQPASV